MPLTNQGLELLSPALGDDVALKLTKDDQDWVRDEFARQRSNQKVPDWAKTSIAVITTIIAAVVWLTRDHIPVQLAPIYARLGNVESSAMRTEGKVDGVLSDTLRRLLDQAKDRPSATTALDNADGLLRSATNHGITLPPTDVQAIGAVLDDLRRRDQGSGPLWQAIGTFANYKSAAFTLSIPSDKPCAHREPGTKFVAFEGFVFRNCTMDLDDAKWVNVTFTDSLIRYRGGALDLERVRFVNCIFDFRMKAPPAASAQQLMATVLQAQSLSEILQ